MGAAEFYRAVPNSDVDVQTINQLAKFLARFEEGNSLRGHFDSGSGFWIASDARSSLPRVEASESTDLNLVPRSQGTDDAVKYGTDDDVGFLPGHPKGLINFFGQIGPGHLERPHRVTKEYNSVTWCSRCRSPTRRTVARRRRFRTASRPGTARR